MAPFIPQGYINPELTLFFALMLGIGFGYILEQAGFSSARKLAGVFYGYDFVVLRVFFNIIFYLRCSKATKNLLSANTEPGSPVQGQDLSGCDPIE